MAENVLETRILLRYGTYSQWMNSNVILKVGEAAVCAFPYSNNIYQTGNHPENTPPAIGIKIGDGIHYFHELPWIQAVAADVYSWAKSSTKPTYTAQEIEGLQSFVENLVGGDVEVNIAPRIYQLTTGEGANANKYYLRYKENTEESAWIVDTSQYIDLSDLVAIKNWITESDINSYYSLGDRTEEHIQYHLNRLNVTDSDTANQVVTSVSQTKGKISTTKRKLNFSNLDGTVSVTQGGTGRTELTEDYVLVGNGTDAVKLIPIADSIATNTAFVPNYLIKSYVDQAVEGLTGAMHFIGEATVVIVPNLSVNPQIAGYDFSKAQLGDVILYNQQEFVWTGGGWRLLGDEGSYAIKGSITDGDIAIDAGISASKIAGLTELLNTKVDKVEGKTLSSNDYSDEDKQKLDDIEAGAQANVIEHIFLNNNEVSPTTINALEKSVNLQVQEFDNEAQTKLQSIQTGAQVNSIEHIFFDGTEIVPDENKTITILSDPHTEHENKIESIIINGTTYRPNQNKEVQITIDQAALNLNVLEGATIPNGQGGRADITQVDKKLELETIAVTGNVKDLRQTTDTYIVLDCGTSTTVI